MSIGRRIPPCYVAIFQDLYSSYGSRSGQLPALTGRPVLQDYANAKGVDLIGDMPIYVGGQSADVWANQNLFELGDNCAPEFVSGVPPDAFSATGQLWGSPLYRWEAHSEEGYAWWAQRIGRAGQVWRNHWCRGRRSLTCC